MPFILTRIDDRLIHGQVVVGWGNFLKPNRIILCNDSIASSDWQKDMYSSAGSLANYNTTISIMSELETVSFLNNNIQSKDKVILLLESPHDVYSIIEKGASIQNVNIGGMHFKKGKRQLAPYIFVDDDDLFYFKQLFEKDVKLEGQDVPTSNKIDVSELIDLV